MRQSRELPLVAHVVHHFGTGGMENGLVHLINGTPPGRYRHALVCLTDAGPFVERIRVPDVTVIELNRRAGHDFRLYGRLWDALRRLSPVIVHTRNLATLEGQLPAALLRSARRVHGEHGRDVFDLQGTNRKYNLLRRGLRPLVHKYVAVSKDLAAWLETTVGVSPSRIQQIYNGVDLARFSPRSGAPPDPLPEGFPARTSDTLCVGTVGRLAGVKDQATLLHAYAQMRGRDESLARRVQLAIVGDGPEGPRLRALAHELGIADRTWFAGDRGDVPEIMRCLDLFVLPSLGEGVSNTVLEAMASGLPVLATRVGGNPELVREGVTGELFSVGQSEALADMMYAYLRDDSRRRACGVAARSFVSERFSWERCVNQYLDLYDALLGSAPA